MLSTEDSLECYPQTIEDSYKCCLLKIAINVIYTEYHYECYLAMNVFY